MVLLDISRFSNYIPTTVLGLLGLLFAYLYGYYRNRDKMKVQNLKAIPPAQRSKVVEMMLNDLGVQIDLADLNSKQRFDLVSRLIRAKSRKYLIIAITSIVLSIIVAFLVWSNYRIVPPLQSEGDSTKTSIKPKTQESSIVHDTIVKTVIISNEPKSLPVSDTKTMPTGNVPSLRVQKKTTPEVLPEIKESQPSQPQTFSIALVSEQIKMGTLIVDGTSLGVFNLENGKSVYHNIAGGFHVFEVQDFRWYGEDASQDPPLGSTERRLYVEKDMTLEIIMTMSDGPESVNFRKTQTSDLKAVRY